MSGIDSSRYRAIVASLAGSALDAAEREGLRVGPGQMSLGWPAAAGLLDCGRAEAALEGTVEGLAQTARSGGENPPRLVTLTQQSRPVYYPLALHLHFAAWRKCGGALTGGVRDACLAALRVAVEPLTRELDAGRDFLAVRLWRELCRIEAAHLLGDPAIAEGAAEAVDEILVQPGRAGSLHHQGPEDQLDAWTYQELAGLHALAHLVQQTNRPGWRARLIEAAGYHLDYTQPDYTTYEPWGTAAFMLSANTVIFADQQLHDVATNLELSGRVAGLMAGLLLADTADLMERLT